MRIVLFTTALLLAGPAFAQRDANVAPQPILQGHGQIIVASDTSSEDGGKKSELMQLNF